MGINNAGKMITDIKLMLISNLKNISTEDMPNNQYTRLLVSKKTAFLLSGLSYIDTFNIVCDERNNSSDAKIIFVSLTIKFREPISGRYSFTIKLERDDEPI